jgi:hypothetical protein
MKGKPGLLIVGSVCALVFALVAVAPTQSQSGTALTQSALAQQPDAGKRMVVEAYNKLPLGFEPNRGQTDSEVKFLSRGDGYALFLTSEGAVLTLRRPETNVWREADAFQDKESPEEAVSIDRAVLTMSLLGVNRDAQVQGLQELAGKCNYFKGNDPKKWVTGVPTYAKVEYQGIYPGIDVIYYGNQRQLEYDFVIAPASDPGLITIGFEGADNLEIDGEGNLILHNDGRDVIVHSPVIYQETNGARHSIAGGYEFKSRNQVGFQVGSYDHSKPLIVDPLILSYSTYLGGRNQEVWGGIAVDGYGCAYVTGYTYSNDFPTKNPYQGGIRGDMDCFLTKFSADGSALVFSTYIGGSSFDDTHSVGLDGVGCVYMAGHTRSDDFPTKYPYQSYRKGGDDIFATKFDPTGQYLIYSTYLGGQWNEYARGVAVDGTGSMYVVGHTTSDDFPTKNPFQDHLKGRWDAFVTRFNTSGDDVIFSTYLGGSDDDQCFGVAVDVSVEGPGCAYITGITWSYDFPTRDPYQGSLLGNSDAYVAKFNPAGSDLVYSTYLGGNDRDEGYGIAVDSYGSAFVTGNTSSYNFPIKNAYQGTLAGWRDTYVTKFNGTGSDLEWSTFFGGSSGDDYGASIAVYGHGSVYVAGYTSSQNFPTKNAYQDYLAGDHDAYVAKFTYEGNDLIFSTYLGGGGRDEAHSLALDSYGGAYVTGTTTSNNFPLENPFQDQKAGDADDFVAKLVPNSLPICDAGGPYRAECSGSQGTNVTLDGTGSYDPEEDSLIFAWSAPGVVFDDPTSPTPTGAFPLGSTQVTLKVSDGELSDSCFSTVDVTDTRPPEITCPPDVVREANADCQVTYSRPKAHATDDCDAEPTIMSVPQLPATFTGLGTYTITWIAMDASENSDTCYQTITVVDKMKPDITCPEDVTLEADSMCQATYEGPPATALDNCDPRPVVTSTPALPVTFTGVGTYTITWTATDSSGNADTCYQTIEVIDRIRPVIACPPDTIMQADGECQVTYSGPPATATDNCDESPEITSVPTLPATFTGVGTYTITWTATDASGNKSICDQTITVIDMIPPEITCPHDTIMQANGQCQVTYSQPPASATDNCDESPEITSVPPLPATFTGVGTYTITWTATDAWGNKSTCDQKITVIDVIPPAITCPKDSTMKADANCQVIYAGPPATALDNCDRNPKITSVPPLPATFTGVGTYTITWTATDSSGNKSTCDQKITVIDVIPPAITCPKDSTMKADANCQVVYAGPPATALDNCDRNPKITSAPPLPATFTGVGTYTITWTAIDSSGNKSTCDQKITVIDVTPPAITCPRDSTMKADDKCQVTYAGPPATATDNCDANPKITSAPSLPATFTGVGTYTITWTATDASGNKSTCDQKITVIDVIPPTITCPRDSTMKANDKCQVTYSGPPATAIDNCDPSPKITSAPPLPATFTGVGTYTITWTATDASGNKSTCDQKITVIDVIPPVITCPKDSTMKANDKCQVTYSGPPATAVDNCDASPKITSAPSLPATFTGVGTYIITWTATDTWGNKSSCDQKITVIDVTPPTITCPKDSTMKANDKCQVTYSGPPATAIDNCDASPKITSAPSLPATFTGVGTYTITWTATDASGNKSTCDQRITVIDVTPPTITCPKDSTMKANDKCQVTYSGPPATAVDNCDASPKITSAPSLPATFTGVGTYIITWTATDAWGNKSSCDQKIKVIDVTPPTITCPKDVVIPGDVNCEVVYAGPPASAVDNCDSRPKITSVPPLPATFKGVGSHAIVYTATDASGNSSTCTQTVAIIDVTPPVITCPPDTAIAPEGSECHVTYDGPPARAADNCDGNPTVTSVPPLPAAFDKIGDHTITFTAKDFSGNASVCSMTVRVISTSQCMKPEVIAELQAMLPTGDKNLDKYIEKAIEHIQKSLDPEYWIDNTHLNCKNGKKVFYEEKKAAHYISKLCMGDKCKGVISMSLIYNGSKEVLIEAKSNKKTCFGPDFVSPGDTFDVVAVDDKLGTETELWVEGKLTQKIHTSCSQPLDEGMVFGDFTVEFVEKIPEGKGKYPGEVCDRLINMLLNADEMLARVQIEEAKVYPGAKQKEIDKAEKEMTKAQEDRDKGDYSKAFDHYKKAWEYAWKAMGGCPKEEKCKGVISLTLIYHGQKKSLIEAISRNKTCFGPKTVAPGDTFKIVAVDEKLGTETYIYANKVLDQKIHTSCSQPIEKGMIFGNYEVYDVVKIMGEGGVMTSLETGGFLIFSLSQNNPNPFARQTTISFTLPARAHTTLTIYDIAGRAVAVLADREMERGTYSLVWNRECCASGIYFYRLESGNRSLTKKMTVVK